MQAALLWCLPGCTAASAGPVGGARCRKMVAVVKANAYGHGLLETARTLPDADAFGVAPSRRSSATAWGITKPVLLLEGFFDAKYCRRFSAQHFHTAVHNKEQLAALEEATWTAGFFRLDETRYRYAPSGA